jgi:hypothetical protein
MRLRSAQHLAHPRHVWGVMFCMSAEALHERLQHLLLQRLHELPEHAVGIGIHELVASGARDMRPPAPSASRPACALRGHLLELACCSA